VEKAMQEKRVNKLKKSALDSIIGKRVFRKEALLRGLDKTPQYQRQVKEREDSVLFGMFVQKVVARNVKLGDEDIKTYYNDHLADYEYPSMVRLNGLAFDKLPDAESALEKLKKGADYAWIKENAAGQTDKDADNLLVFDGVLILTKLPQDVQKSLSGAKAGDHRLAAGPDGRFYVLSVQDVIPARTQTIEEATATIVKTVFKSKLDKSLKEWEEQLRQTADIEIYLQH
jgi:CRISPR/Cas system CMR-associated protein Cmr5 small subunit